MPQFIPHTPARAASRGPASWPTVRIDLRCGDGPVTHFEFQQESILLGTHVGCDVRFPMGELPPLAGLLTCHGDQLHWRNLGLDLPPLVGGAPLASGWLLSQDELKIGPVSLTVHLLAAHAAAASPAALTPTEPARPDLDAARQQWEEERRDWEQEAVRQAEGLAHRSRQLLNQEKELAHARAEVERRSAALAEAESRANTERETLARQTAEVAEQRTELEQIRTTLAHLRHELYEHYRRKRDKVVALRAAVQQAARNLQQEKQALRAELDDMRHERAALDQRAAALTAQEQDLHRQVRYLAAREATQADEAARRDSHWLQRQAELAEWEKQLTLRGSRLAEDQRTFQQDLAQLHRLQQQHAQEQSDLVEQREELAAWRDRLTQLAAELQDQTRETAAWDARLQTQAAELAEREAALVQDEAHWRQQQGDVETAQLALAQAHQRLDQSRRRLEQREHQLAQEQVRLTERGAALDASAAGLHEAQQRLRAERDAWVAEQQSRAAQQAQWEEAAARLRDLESQFALAEAEWSRRQRELDLQAQAQQDSSLRLRERWRKLLEVRRAWRAERHQWHGAAQELAEAEVARQALQEQLRRRAIDLQEREQRLAEREAQLQAALERVALEQEATARLQADLAERAATVAAEAQQHQAQFTQRSAMLEEQAAAVAQARADLVRQEQEQARAAAELAEQRAAFTAQADTLLAQTQAQREQLPDLLAQAHAGLGLLNQARAQLRLHLDEIHQYVHKSQGLLSDSQRDLAAGQEMLRQQRAALHRQQAEHRHEVSAFKLFLGEWQERLEEFRQNLLREQSAVAQRAAALAAQHAELDRSAAALNQRESQVAEQEADVNLRREEINRHLQDLQRWYRQKMRELADRHLLQPEADESSAQGLRLVTDDEADQDERLAASLLDLELVDAATLAELRGQAQAEQRSLGRLLVDGDLLTSWQLQTILAGRLSDLVIGDLRVLDVVGTTTWEIIRQVYDPRHGAALLRCLLPHVERGRQAEYRAGFTAATQVRSDHVAATFDLLDVAGAPAVLQEWVVGLPATAWREMARVPAVWLRLVEQAALGLAAIHAAGMVHGHLHEGRLLLDATGRLRLCGLGEPDWLEASSAPAFAYSSWEDLQRLGRIAASWLTAQSSSRLGRAQQSPLEEVVQALLQPNPSGKVTSAAELAEHVHLLRRRSADDELAWQRLLAYLHERLHESAGNARPRHAA